MARLIYIRQNTSVTVHWLLVALKEMFFIVHLLANVPILALIRQINKYEWRGMPGYWSLQSYNKFFSYIYNFV